MSKTNYAQCRECNIGSIKIIITSRINGDTVVNTEKCSHCNYSLNKNDFEDLMSNKFLNVDKKKRENESNCDNYKNGFYSEYGVDMCVNCGERKSKHKQFDL